MSGCKRKMAEVLWRQEALDQLDAIIAYIKLFDPVAAVETGARLFALGESLTDFPNRGRAAENGLREMVTVTPYILSYRVEGNEVSIVELRHSRQRPRGHGSA